MKSLPANRIREEFLRYFESKGHQRIRSASLIPTDDPSVLLTTAGMQQFKPYFLGERQPPSRRLTSAQKCFRTSDIEEVGDASHNTFFEMLGNFSVGDYFKKEAIDFAWELLVDRWEIPAERLSITVFAGEGALPPDEEAEELWQARGVPVERIHRFGSRDNFWGPPGPTGPCGPCSEVHYDLTGKSCGSDACGPNCPCGRFLEIWNLVFMEYNKQDAETFLPLPSKNIDTGMGLERIAFVLQGKDGIFSTDLFAPLLGAISNLFGTSGRETEPEVLRSTRIIADHVRGAVFLVSDGVLPSNDGRGYVLRRILRKAVVHGRRLGKEGPFVERLLDPVIDTYREAYPELAENRNFIHRVLGGEEKKFLETLETGIRIFQEERKRMEAAGERVFPGEVAFRLYDTYGFPHELTEDMARESGMELDRAGFERAMAEQREKARAAWRGERETAWDEGEAPSEVRCEFVGYDGTEARAPLTHLFAGGKRVGELREGQEGRLVCATTPFYAEGGGQVGDRGIIEGPEGSFEVHDTKHGPGEIILHVGKVLRGVLREGQEVLLKVDVERRRATARNHTATHLLHYALRTLLGDHVRQAGSLVTPERLRFDFTHFAALTDEELEALETLVNRKILENQPLQVRVVPFQTAREEKAIALFGEKYEDVVRMVSIQDYSKELCGGTHVERTGDIGLFKILHESSVASGVRRIEAVTGEAALEHTRRIEKEYRLIAQGLQARPGEVAQRVRQLQERQKELEKALKGRKKDQLKEAADKILRGKETIGGEVACVTAKYEGDADTLRRLADLLRDRIGEGVILLGSPDRGKALLVLAVTKGLSSRFHAGRLIREVAKEVGGGGGGKPDMAQAGGPSPEGLDRAFRKLKDLLAAPTESA